MCMCRLPRHTTPVGGGWLPCVGGGCHRAAVVWSGRGCFLIAALVQCDLAGAICRAHASRPFAVVGKVVHSCCASPASPQWMPRSQTQHQQVDSLFETVDGPTEICVGAGAAVRCSSYSIKRWPLQQSCTAPWLLQQLAGITLHAHLIKLLCCMP